MKDVIRKFRFKTAGIVINAPFAMEKEFVELGFSTMFDKDSKSGNTLVFVNNIQECVDFLTNQLQYILPDSVFWIAYPKASSKIKTDINRDSLRITAETYGIKTVTAISIDEIWSALRFRPIDRVGK